MSTDSALPGAQGSMKYCTRDTRLRRKNPFKLSFSFFRTMNSVVLFSWWDAKECEWILHSLASNTRWSTVSYTLDQDAKIRANSAFHFFEPWQMLCFLVDETPRSVNGFAIPGVQHSMEYCSRGTRSRRKNPCKLSVLFLLL